MSGMIGAAFFMRELGRALRNLAADADEQRRYLESLGTAPMADELALEFDDFASRVVEAVRKGLLSRDTGDAINAIDAFLSSISGEANGSLWTVDALYTAPQWVQVRLLAAEALRHYERDTSGS